MTNAEKKHQDKLRQLGCIVCYHCLGLMDLAVPSIHHVREGMGMSQKNSEYNVLPLCKIHHQDGDGTAKVQGAWGYHKNKTEFERMYGTEKELLEIIKTIIQ